MNSLKARLGVSVPTGNEGAGTVVAAGSSPEAQALIGRTVAVLGRTMYSQYRCMAAEQCLVLPDDAKPADGASAFINPLTVLGMVETMRMEGHKALVNTAAASNLGQMLNRVCQQDRINLVNIVRNPEQEKLLRSIGAQYVCNSRSPTFMSDLTDALHATGATLAFDAVGGGPLTGQILECMESALIRDAKAYSRYGSTTHKQVYIYGWLEYSQTTLGRSYGMSWGVGGWLLTNFMNKIGAENALRLKQRVAAELRTTFASHYAGEISLAQALDLDTIATYGKPTTGQKYLINPNKDVD
jgi:NADPH2:quinone reductase